MPQHGKTAVVTGACGFIGSHMVEVLAKENYEVIATDHPNALEPKGKVQKMCLDVVREKASRLVPADITAKGALDEVVKGADYVFHVASVFSYSAPWQTLYKVNVQGTNNLIDSLVNTGTNPKRLVVWGAGGVYGIPSKENLPLTEETPPNPPNNYLKSKWFQEFLVMERCSREGIKWTIIRPTTVYGIRQVYGFPQFYQMAYNAKVVMTPVSLQGRIPFVHVEDVCYAALHLAKFSSGANNVFNVNDDSQMTTFELMRFLAMLFGKPFVPLPAVPIESLKPALSFVAGLVQLVARHFGVASPLEKDTVAYLNADFVYSNEKLKKAGYQFRHPDPKPALAEIANWYVQNGLLEKGGM